MNFHENGYEASSPQVQPEEGQHSKCFRTFADVGLVRGVPLSQALHADKGK